MQLCLHDLLIQVARMHKWHACLGSCTNCCYQRESLCAEVLIKHVMKYCCVRAFHPRFFPERNPQGSRKAVGYLEKAGKPQKETFILECF